MSDTNPEDVSDESPTFPIPPTRLHPDIARTPTPSIDDYPNPFVNIPKSISQDITTKNDKKRKFDYDAPLFTATVPFKVESPALPDDDLFAHPAMNLLKEDFINTQNENKKRRKQATPIRVSNLFEFEDKRENLQETTAKESDVRNGSKLIPLFGMEPLDDIIAFSNKENRESFQHSIVKEGMPVPGPGPGPVPTSSNMNDNLKSVDFINKEIKTESVEENENKKEDSTPQLSGMRDEWFPMLPFNIFPDNNFLQKNHFLPKNGFLADGNFLPFITNMPANPPVRIFNPEAYCNLCHKEFCNKYFLKTHKANKHGIYENISAGDPGLLFNPLAKLHKSDGIPQENSLNLIMNQFSGKLSQSQNTVPEKTDDTLLPNLVSKLSVSTIIGNDNQLFKNPEMNCDICMRKFPNIFFLRHHAIEEHGMEQSVEQPLEIKTTKMDEKQLSPGLKLSVLDKSSRSPQYLDEINVENRELMFPRKLSPNSCQLAKNCGFAPLELKKLGVLNTEAFCELCCKEYCNKYFLRTHKFKRHGILIPDDSSSKDERRPSGQAQTSPLNLIMEDRLKTPHLHLHDDTLSFEDRCEDYNNSSPLPPIDKHHDSSKVKTNVHDIDSIKENIDLKMKSAEIDFLRKPEDVNERISPKSDISSTSQDLCKDLQKLQSMILQLNNLQNKNTQLSCGCCGKQMKDEASLQLHMATHAVDKNENVNKLEEYDDLDVKIDMEERLTQKEACNSELYEDLKRNDILYPQNYDEMHKTPEKQMISMATTPNLSQKNFSITNSFCEICNKQLCNKYFMKTHMEKMHGIQINNEFKIGGVICDICQKELCSKYFLKVHKQNTHGIFEENSNMGQGSGIFPSSVNFNQSLGISQNSSFSHGSVLARNNGEPEIFTNQVQETASPLIKPPEPLKQDLMDLRKPYAQNLIDLSKTVFDFASTKSETQTPIPKPPPPSIPPPRSNSAELSPLKTNIVDFSQRYFTHFNEVCQICSRRFRSTKWLRAHLINDHGTKLENLQKVDSSNSDSNIPIDCSNSNSNSNSNYDKTTLKIPHDNVQNMTMPLVSNIFDGGPSKTYKCNYCEFSSPILALLFVHERSHTNNGVCGSNMGQITSINTISDIVTPLETLGSPPSVNRPSPAVTPNLSEDNLNPKTALRSAADNFNLVATYALPDEDKLNRKYLMQAFILEEFCERKYSREKNTNDILRYKDKNDEMQIKKHKIYKSQDGDQKDDSPKGNNTDRDSIKQPEDITNSQESKKLNIAIKQGQTILPAVIYLPVVEKINNKTSVTFNLTPI